MVKFDIPMQRYQSIKKVDAAPMSNNDYRELYLKNREPSNMAVPKVSSSILEGYLVRYNAGTDAEYYSWSPKDVFNEGNVPIKE